jgi:hypothetical protein
MFFTRLVVLHSSLLAAAAIVAAVSFVAGRDAYPKNFRKSCLATDRIESFAATDRVHGVHLG